MLVWYDIILRHSTTARLGNLEMLLLGREGGDGGGSGISGNFAINIGAWLPKPKTKLRQVRYCYEYKFHEYYDSVTDR